MLKIDSACWFVDSSASICQQVVGSLFRHLNRDRISQGFVWIQNTLQLPDIS